MGGLAIWGISTGPVFGNMLEGVHIRVLRGGRWCEGVGTPAARTSDTAARCLLDAADSVHADTAASCPSSRTLVLVVVVLTST